jgi:hypothetical protein
VFTPLNDPNASDRTGAYGINTSGKVVGYYHFASAQVAPNLAGFLLTGVAYTDLAGPAYGINDSDQIVGYRGIGNSSTNQSYLYKRRKLPHHRRCHRASNTIS